MPAGIQSSWRFCPHCRSDLGTGPDHLACPSCGAKFWPASVPGIQGVLERDGRILLARRANEPRRGYWDLPGGFLEEGEAPLDGLRREFREETGLEIEPVSFLRVDVEPYFDRWVFSVSWLVHADGEPVAADDVDELRWFAPHELPAEMAFPGQDEVVREWAGRISAGPSSESFPR